MSRCQSCGAPIRWVITLDGARMPLDPDPHPRGNVVPELQGRDGQAPRAVVLAKPATDRPAWVSHFTTCRSAASHRRS